MTSINHRLKAAVVSAFLWPTIGSAVPIVDPLLLPSAPAVVGWANAEGTFVVGDPTIDGIAGPGPLSYSTATSLLSYQSTSQAFFVDGVNVTGGPVPVDAQISAIVLGDGTVTGNLVGGTLVIAAGAGGIPELGAAAGETLVTGTAIDSAAVPSQYSVALLFDLTYTIPALAGLGEFLTFQASNPLFFGPGGFQPWDVTSTVFGFSFDDFIPTHKVPEPATFALVLAAFGAMGIATRRRKCALV